MRVAGAKNDIASEWVRTNYILAAGEDGYEIGTGKHKTGDGETAWLDLPYTEDVTTENVETVVTEVLGTVVEDTVNEALGDYIFDGGGA